MKLQTLSFVLITILIGLLASPTYSKLTMKNKESKIGGNESNHLKVEIKDTDSAERKSQKKLYNDLLNYMLKNGSTLKKFSMKFLSDTNRYIYATEDIRKDEVIAEIPKSLMILENSEELDSFKQKIGEGTSDKISNAFFLFLLEGKKKPSISKKFQLYFRMLPKEMSSIPLLFKTNEEKELYNSSKLLKKELDKEREGFEKDFSILSRKKLISKATTLYEYMEAGKLFISRNFYIENNGKQEQTLIPLVDLFNYDNKSNRVIWEYNSQREVFVIKAENDIKKKQEILLDYGNNSKSYFLFHYGFTTPTLPREDITLSRKGVEIPLTSKFDFDQALKPIKDYFKSNSTTKKELNFLLDAIDDIYKYFNSSLEDDKKRLKAEKSFSIKNILRVLIDQKSILKEYAKKALKELNKIDNQNPRIKAIGYRIGIRVGLAVAVNPVQVAVNNNDSLNKKKKPVKKAKGKKNKTKKYVKPVGERKGRFGGAAQPSFPIRIPQTLQVASSLSVQPSLNSRPVTKS